MKKLLDFEASASGAAQVLCFEDTCVGVVRDE